MCHLKLITGCKIYVWFKFNISCVLVWADWLICLELDASGLSPKYLVGLLSTSNFYQITLSLINWSAHAYKRAFLNPSLGHWNPWKQSVSAIFERWLKYCVFFSTLDWEVDPSPFYYVPVPPQAISSHSPIAQLISSVQYNLALLKVGYHDQDHHHHHEMFRNGFQHFQVWWSWAVNRRGGPWTSSNR